MRPIKLMDSKYRTWAFLCGRCKRVHSPPDRLGVTRARTPDAIDVNYAREAAERCCRCGSCNRPTKTDKEKTHQRCMVCEAKATKAHALYRRRMKVTRRWFLQEYNRRLNLARSQDAAFLLVAQMRELSEQMWCAGWSSGLEFDLWFEVLRGGVDPVPVGMVGPSNLTCLEAVKLRELARRAGGWWMWWQEPKGCAGVRESGEVFVPMAEWRKVYDDHCEKQKAQGDT